MSPPIVSRGWAWAAGALILWCAWGAGAQTYHKSPRVYPVGPRPCAIVAQDLDDDGLPEIVTADRGTLTDPREQRPANNEISILDGQEPLAYARRTPPPSVGYGPYCLAIANMDGIKAPDILVGAFMATGSRNITLLRNLPELFEPIYFSVPPDSVRYERMTDTDGQPLFARPGITGLAVASFNEDAYRDVVAAGWTCDALLFFPGHATEYLTTPRIIPAPGGPRDVQAADFDKDGKMDLAVTLYSAGKVGLWRNEGAAGFVQAELFSTRSPLPHKLRVADMNGDGVSDLAVSHCDAADSVGIFFGDGGFAFSVSQEILLPPAGASKGEKAAAERARSREVLEDDVRDMAVEDLNGDGRPDIAVACAASGRLIVLFQASSNGRVPLEFRREIYTYPDAQVRAVCAADFDQDGKKDLAVALWSRNGDCVALLTTK